MCAHGLFGRLLKQASDDQDRLAALQALSAHTIPGSCRVGTGTVQTGNTIVQCVGMFHYSTAVFSDHAFVPRLCPSHHCVTIINVYETIVVGHVGPGAAC